jgi:hypothetical protein
MAQDDYWGAVHQMNQAELIMELRRQQDRSARLLAECLSELSRIKRVVNGSAYA